MNQAVQINSATKILTSKYSKLLSFFKDADGGSFEKKKEYIFKKIRFSGVVCFQKVEIRLVRKTQLGIGYAYQSNLTT